MVVVVLPEPEDLAGMGQAVEHFFVQAFVFELPVEALDDAALVLPFEDGGTSQFCTVIADNGFWPAIETDAAIQFADHARTRQRCICHQCKAFSGVVVDDVQHPETPRRIEDVRREVEAPALSRFCRNQHGASCADGPFTPATPAHGQAFLPI